MSGIESTVIPTEIPNRGPINCRPRKAAKNAKKMSNANRAITENMQQS
jgi:hypothetical protein